MKKHIVNSVKGPADISIKTNPGHPEQPLLGVPLPVKGIVALIDHIWNEKFASSAGYSYLHIVNAEASDESSFKTGNYAIGNLIYTPVPKLMAVVELQYGTRENFTDGFSSSAVKVQFSLRSSYKESLF